LARIRYLPRITVPGVHSRISSRTAPSLGQMVCSSEYLVSQIGHSFMGGPLLGFPGVYGTLRKVSKACPKS
jgi:hypothetical protein